MTTYDTLRSAAGKLPPLDDKTPDDEHFKRLVLAVSSLSVPAFEKLPDDAREWFDSAADALSAGFKIPAPSGFDRDAVLYPPAPIRIARPSGTAYAVTGGGRPSVTGGAPTAARAPAIPPR